MITDAELLFTKVLFETDCIRLKQAWDRSIGGDYSYFGGLVSDYRTKSRSFAACRLCHVKRGSNMEADILLRNLDLLNLQISLLQFCGWPVGW